MGNNRAGRAAGSCGRWMAEDQRERRPLAAGLGNRGVQRNL